MQLFAYLYKIGCHSFSTFQLVQKCLLVSGGSVQKGIDWSSMLWSDWDFSKSCQAAVSVLDFYEISTAIFIVGASKEQTEEQS